MVDQLRGGIILHEDWPVKPGPVPLFVLPSLYTLLPFNMNCQDMPDFHREYLEKKERKELLFHSIQIEKP
jgi:hypothetical protein